MKSQLVACVTFSLLFTGCDSPTDSGVFPERLKEIRRDCVSQDDGELKRRHLDELGRYVRAEVRIQARMVRSVCYESLGMHGEALTDLTYVIDASEALPTLSLVYYQRGTIYKLIGRFDEAIADFSRSLELDRTSFGTYIARAEAFAANDQVHKAIEDYENALEELKRRRPCEPEAGCSGAAYPEAWVYIELLRLYRTAVMNERYRTTLNEAVRRNPGSEDLAGVAEK